MAKGKHSASTISRLRQQLKEAEDARSRLEARLTASQRLVSTLERQNDAYRSQSAPEVQAAQTRIAEVQARAEASNEFQQKQIDATARIIADIFTKEELAGIKLFTRDQIDFLWEQWGHVDEWRKVWSEHGQRNRQNKRAAERWKKNHELVEANERRHLGDLYARKLGSTK